MSESPYSCPNTEEQCLKAYDDRDRYKAALERIAEGPQGIQAEIAKSALASMIDWTCPNCGTANEFSVQHCAPDDIGAIYPVIECHVCGLICSDERAERIRANWPKTPQSDASAES